ncbi:MAG: LacI family DNA-binding transcriptional regulator [Alphaproteobacteria bacterium]
MKKQKKRINIKYVAETANVSTATVSRVLNQTGYVKKETRDYVRKIIDDLGYRSNSIAKSLRSHKSQYVALIIPDIENEYFAILSRYIERFLQISGYGVFISSIEQSLSKALWYANIYVDHFVAGAILLTDYDEVTQIFTKANIPVVVADRLEDKKTRPHVSFIGSDNESGGFLAAQNLINYGAKRLMFLRDEQNLTNVNEREKGFIKAIRETKNREIEVKVVPHGIDRTEIYNNIYSIYKDWEFDGLFCSSDYIAITAMSGLMKHDVAVPSDVQIIGYDGVPSTRYLAPTLATITQSLKQMSEKIAQVIQKMIEDEGYHIDLMMPVKLQKGDTLRGSGVK